MLANITTGRVSLPWLTKWRSLRSALPHLPCCRFGLLLPGESPAVAQSDVMSNSGKEFNTLESQNKTLTVLSQLYHSWPIIKIVNYGKQQVQNNSDSLWIVTSHRSERYLDQADVALMQIFIKKTEPSVIRPLSVEPVPYRKRITTLFELTKLIRLL